MDKVSIPYPQLKMPQSRTQRECLLLYHYAFSLDAISLPFVIFTIPAFRSIPIIISDRKHISRLMRPNRIPTPTHYGSHSNLTPFRDTNPQQPPPPKKYYTRDEVSQILRQTLESKLSKIYRELEEKQKLIKSLNEQLSQNDQKMTLLENKIRSMHVQEQNY